MTFASLLPSWIDVGWAVGAVAGLAYFFRERLAKLVDARLQHGYNAELERLKDQLASSTKEMDTLRSSILSLRAQRQAAVEKRKLEAIDQIWAAVKALQARKAQGMTMSFVDFEKASVHAKDDPRVRQVFEIIGGGKIEDTHVPEHEAHVERASRISERIRKAEHAGAKDRVDAAQLTERSLSRN